MAGELSPWSIVPVAGQVAQSLIDAKQSRENVDKTISANKQLAEYQYSKDLDMWNKQNEYNNPTSQMARLKAAGLNPNLAYGSGSVAGNVSSQLPKYNAPTADYTSQVAPVNIPAMLNQFQDFQVKQAQIDNLKVQGKMLGEDYAMKWMSFGDRLRQIQQGATEKEYNNFLRGIGYGETDIMKDRGTGHQETSSRRLMPGELFGFQSDVLRNNLSKVGADIARINADTELTKKKSEWYLSELFGKTLGGFAGKFLGSLVPKSTRAGTLNQKMIKKTGELPPWRTTLKPRLHPSRRVQAEKYKLFE